MLTKGFGSLILLVFSLQAHGAGVSRCPREYTGQWKSKLVIHHLSVGQGDSTFIRTPDGTTILIDGGLPSQGREVVIPAIKRCYLESTSQIPRINYVIVTHPHIDHFGGVRELLNAVLEGELDIDHIIDTGSEIQVKKSQELDKYRTLRDLAAHKGLLKKSVPKPGGVIKLGKVSFSVVAVNGKVKGKQPIKMTNSHGIAEGENLNALSIAMKIRFGTFDYFIGGDMTGGGDSTPDVESNVASTVGEIDVYHANHHGSNTSSNNKLLWTTKPKAVIVSVGDGGLNKRYQLPNREAIDRIRELPSVHGIYLTAFGALKSPLPKKVRNEKGDIVLIASETQYIVNQYKYKTDGK